jgi:hypothetical protein
MKNIQYFTELSWFVTLTNTELPHKHFFATGASFSLFKKWRKVIGWRLPKSRLPDQMMVQDQIIIERNRIISTTFDTINYLWQSQNNLNYLCNIFPLVWGPVLLEW